MQLVTGLLSGQVLQRTTRDLSHPARLEGSCAGAGPVLATVRGMDKGVVKRALSGWSKRKIGRAGDGCFQAILAGLPVGGPYQVELIVGNERLTIAEVFVGDLWLMGGQSNMQGIGVLADAPEPHPQVRAFTMARRWELAREPIHFLAESPDPVHHEGRPMDAATAAKAKPREIRGAGVGLWFGRAMHARTGVPQGLIAVAHGGTGMAQWLPAADPSVPAGDSLYGSMFLSLRAVGQPMAGVLWYQGCNDANVDAVPHYRQRMETLVTAVRRDLRQPTLPWLVVQIGREIGRDWQLEQWHAIQELQRRLPETIPKLDVVAAADLEQDDWIHVSTRSFAILAERLAVVADRLVRKLPGAKPGPQPVSATWKPDAVGAAVEVRFRNVVGGLQIPGRPLGFAMLDGAGRSRPLIYQTRLSGDRAILRLTSDELQDLTLHHGVGADPQINATDGRGLALPVFGPLAITGLPPVSRWFRRWRHQASAAGSDLRQIPCPTGDEPDYIEQVFDGWWFVSLPAAPEPGHARFVSHVDLTEDLDGELRFAANAPYRVWIDGREVLADPDHRGWTNQDAFRAPLRLPVGRHPVAVALAREPGVGSGFYFRLAHTPGAKSPEPWR